MKGGESKQKWIKVDLIGWTLMKVGESGWDMRKVDESIREWRDESVG